MAAKHGTILPPSTHVTLLVRLRKDKDAEAWLTFVELYTPLIYRFCRRRSLQDADSRDVTQQVLTSVHRAIGKFDYDRQRGRFRNWLGAVTAHEITRHRSRERRPGRGAGDGWGDDIAALASSAVDPIWMEEFNSHVFQQALIRIRPEFEPGVWQAFDLTWLHDIKPQEAGKRLGKPSAWVYKARYKVLARLRQELEFLSSDAAPFHKPT